MAGSRRRSVIVAALAAAVAIPGGALAAGGASTSQAPAEDGASPYDVRTTAAGRKLAARPSATRRRAQTRLERSLGAGGVVDVDPSTGTPELVLNTRGFLTRAEDEPAGELALDYVRSHDSAFGLDGNDIAGLDLVRRDRTPSGLTVLRWRQAYKGIPAFDNGLNATVRDGRLVSVSGSPKPDLAVRSTEPKLSAAAALRRALADAGADGRRRQSGPPPKLTLFDQGKTTRLAWKLYASADSDHVYLSVVDATSGEILKRVNIVAHASGNALENYPGSHVDTGGSAVGGTYASKTFSTGGSDPWLNSPFDELAGDNALVYADVNDNNSEGATEDIPPSTANGASSLWNYTPPVTDQSVTAIRHCPATGCTWNGDEYTGVFTPLNWQLNQNQAGTQLFWFVNNFHDFLETDAGVAFDDGSNNFEADSGDRVIAHLNDGANGPGGLPDGNHVNNANMTTFPVGSPVMQMYLFEGTNFVRDINGSDDAALVYHEYTHGLSNRLVDPFGTGGLGTAQGGAMGEGWSDWYAFDYLAGQGLEIDNLGNDGEIVLVRYANGQFREQGIDCPLGTNDPDCPNGGYTFGDFGTIIGFPEVHADGEIWAATLWDLRRALIAKYASVPAGELRVRTIVTDGMRISTSAPTYLEMRDAILSATATSFPADLPTVREAFRARGMGRCATTTGPDDTAPVEDFTALTATCPGEEPPPPPPPPPTTTPTTTTPTTTTPTPTPTPTPSGPGKADFSDTKRSIRASRKGRFRIRFRAKAGLEGSAKLVTVKRVSLSARKRRRLALKFFSVSKTGVVTIRVKLSRTNRRILKRYRKLRVKLTVKLRNVDNVTSTSTLRFTLKRPKPAA